ncbi:hypothetical protein, partial [Acidiphilium sp. 37-64-53]|uniref:hypothetical protein n=1 Tax=Acidiphilium sp. 37-64-53 TaxID=1970299 RepID=UPI00257C16FF
GLRRDASAGPDGPWRARAAEPPRGNHPELIFARLTLKNPGLGRGFFMRDQFFGCFDYYSVIIGTVCFDYVTCLPQPVEIK